MGLELKRVALNFDAPIDETWEGYLNPLPDGLEECATCNGSGYSPQAQRFHDQWYGKTDFDPVAYGHRLYSPDDPLIVEEVTRKILRSQEIDRQDGRSDYYTNGGRRSMKDAVMLECHRMTAIYNAGWHYHLIQADLDALIEHKDVEPNTDGTFPSLDDVNYRLVAGSLFYGSGFYYTCLKARCAREGFPVECNTCQGNGEIVVDPIAVAAYEAWERIEPPAGDGWQVWQTVSEGGPISPVFPTAEALAEHLANAKPWGGANPLSAERWLQWITGPGWAPSGVIQDGVFRDGVEAMTQ